jgi:hypothetical protein
MSNGLSLVPHGAEWDAMKNQASLAVQSGFLPQSIKTPQQAVIIALKGRELGIPMMQAFAQISVINGKPAMGAELMLGMIYKNHPRAWINTLLNTDEEACIQAGRNAQVTQKFSFTIKDAQRAGLTSKPVWQQYPKTMLYWRCVSMMARQLFPDAIMGMSHTPEELGAEINEDGEVLVAEVVKVDASPRADSEPNGAPDQGTPAKAADSGEHAPSEPRGEEAAVGEASEPVIFLNKTKDEKNKFKEMALKFGIVAVKDLQALAKECVGQDMDKIPEIINGLLNQGDFDL